VKTVELKELLQTHVGRYSRLLDIRLEEGSDDEIFKWFLMSTLFGAPISESAAVKTYHTFEKHNVLTPYNIIKTGWKGLVATLDEGGYTRYDYKTADKLLEMARNLLDKYDARLNHVHDEASDSRDLENRLKSLAKGIGDVTVSIFLRELRGVWEKADPYPTALEILAAKQLGILKEGVDGQQALICLKNFWSENCISGKSFVEFETALVRLGRQYKKQKS